MGGTWHLAETPIDQGGWGSEINAHGASVPDSKTFKVEEKAGSLRARLKEAQGRPSQAKWGGIPSLGPGHVGQLAPWPVSCCSLVSGGRDRGSGLWPALCSQSNNKEHSLRTCVGPGALRFYTPRAPRFGKTERASEVPALAPFYEKSK